MPIQRGSHAFRRQFDIGGVIRLGGEKEKGEWNTELSYFRLTDAPKLVDIYGERPTELHVMLPSDDPDEVFEDRYELWKGSKSANVKGVLLCNGDGLQAERIKDEDSPWDRDVVPCPCPEDCAYALERTSQKVRKNGGSACSATGRLRVIAYRSSVLEVYEIRTGSINAFQGVRNKLLDILGHPMFGKLRGIPLLLKRVPKKTRFGTTIYPVRIELPTWKELQAEAKFLGNVLGAIQSVTVDALPSSPPAAMLREPEPATDLIPKSQRTEAGIADDRPKTEADDWKPDRVPPQESPTSPDPDPDPEPETVETERMLPCQECGEEHPESHGWMQFHDQRVCSDECLNNAKARLANISTEEEVAGDEAEAEAAKNGETEVDKGDDEKPTKRLWA